MRGRGAFQMAQMKQRDARIFQLCQHLRSAIDIYEQIVSEPFQREEARPSPAAPPAPMPAPVAPQRPALPAEKLTYTLKDATAAIGIGRTTLYKAISDGRLKAVKFGRRTLITADILRELMAELPRIASK